ncbi:MAG: TlpA family protein disulfide reductase [Treponemataceae bacterium]
MKRNLVVLVFLALLANTFAQTVGLKVGNLAPDFMLTTLEAKDVKLSDYRGKPVFLNFWATWCPPCVKEMPAMEKIHQNYSQNITVLAVNVGEQIKPVRDFINKNKLTFSILLDRQSSIARVYSVQAIPTTFILDDKGVIVAVRRGTLTEKEMQELVAKVSS